MESFVSLLIAVIAGVIIHVICKCLDENCNK